MGEKKIRLNTKIKWASDTKAILADERLFRDSILNRISEIPPMERTSVFEFFKVADEISAIAEKMAVVRTGSARTDQVRVDVSYMLMLTTHLIASPVRLRVIVGILEKAMEEITKIENDKEGK